MAARRADLRRAPRRRVHQADRRVAGRVEVGESVHERVALEPVERPGADLGHGKRRRPHDVGAAMLLGRGDAEPHVGAERRHDVPQPLAGHAAARPVDQLADEVAERVGVVRQPLAGRPPCVGGGERSRHAAPVEQVAVRERFADRGDGGAMAEGVGDRGPGLAAGGELRPHVGDRSVEHEPSLVDELQGEQGQDRLPGGVDVDDRVVAPPAGAVLARPPADQVDDHLAADDHVHRRPDLPPVGEVGRERVPDHGEARGAPPVDRRVHAGESAPPRPGVATWRNWRSTSRSERVGMATCADVSHGPVAPARSRWSMPAASRCRWNAFQ